MIEQIEAFVVERFKTFVVVIVALIVVSALVPIVDSIRQRRSSKRDALKPRVGYLFAEHECPNADHPISGGDCELCGKMISS